MVNKIKQILTIVMLYFKFIDNQAVVNLIKRQKRLNEILLNLVIIYAAQEKVRQRSVWTLKHTSSFWEIDCQNNGDNFFKTNFRMSRRSFDKLCVYLKNMEKSNTNWRNAIPLEKRVAIGLYALGSSAEYRTIGNTFGVGKATVCGILIEFCAVWKIMGEKYLNTLPFTKEYIMENVAAFEKMGFPQCFGAIDGCHIEIHPKKVEAIDYYNYKGWYSVVLFALVDAKYRFAYVSCGSPGRCNDSTIFENSNLKRTLEECVYLDQLSWQYKSTNIPVTVLGDSAFRLSKHVMKPYPHTLNNSSAQKAFNYRLSKCRRVVDNAFGHLKARFRRIGKGVDNHLKNVNVIVNSACVLHNFLIEEKDQIVDSWQIELREFEGRRSNPDSRCREISNRAEGEIIRNALSSYFAELPIEGVEEPGDDGTYPGDDGTYPGDDDTYPGDGVAD